jgi:glycosyltransferase involved in cell wall biosynthesis
MNTKKNIQIFYGGFQFNKGGVNSYSSSLNNQLQKKFNVSLYTLDNLPIFIKFIPHITEKIINFLYFPLGFYYKGTVTRFLFKFFFKKKTDYIIFQDIYISWNSNTPSLTILHAIWSDNLQGYNVSKKKLSELKKKEINKINSINHSLSTVSVPYRKFILKEHFFNKINKKIKVTELGIEKNLVKNKKKIKRKPKSLIYVGSLEHRKNIFFLIDVFYKLYTYSSKYTLTIIGSGPLKQELIKYSKKLNLEINFLQNKNKKEIFNELFKHEIYIHTSIKESFSLSLLEAKISGLTTVAYKKLQIPKNFIDIPINDFVSSLWFSKIIKLRKTKKKIKINRYLIDKTVEKLTHLFE